MATIVNERDVLIRSAPSRLIDHDLASNVNVPTFKGISLAAPGAIFRVAVNGDVSPTSITLTATPRGFSETPAITWSVVYGDLGTDPVGTGLTYEMVAANMLTDVVTVQVSVTSSGMTYTDAVMFVKIQDGSIGLPGSRGSINAVRAITGTAWSSFEATMALIDFGLEDPFDPIAGDVVTLHNLNAGFSEIRRYSGSVWVLEAPAFPGKNILKGSVATEQLLVTGMAESLNADPNTVDITAWVGNGITVVADTTAPNGATALRCAGQGTTVLSRKFAVNASDNYRVQTWAKADSGAPTAFLMVAFYDAAGDVISGSSSPSGWTSSGDFHYFGLANQVMPTTWTHYDASFGLDETFKVPSGATHAAIGLISNFSSGTVQRISGMVCRRKVDGRVVVDGSLAARHIDSKGLTVRNELGEVLLDASGSSVPPWVVQDDVGTIGNAGDPGSVQWAKPPDQFNKSYLRSLLVDDVALKASVSASGNSIRVESSARDVWHVTYAGDFSLYPADGLVPLSYGFFTMAPNTAYLLTLSFATRIINNLGTPSVALSLSLPPGCSVRAGAGGSTTVVGASRADVAVGSFTPSASDTTGWPGGETRYVYLKTGAEGGAFNIKAQASQVNVAIGEGTTFSLARINNFKVPEQGYAASVATFPSAGSQPTTSIPSSGPITCSVVSGQAYQLLVNMDVTAIKWCDSDIAVEMVYDAAASRLKLVFTLYISGVTSSSPTVSNGGSATFAYAIVNNVSSAEAPQWSAVMASEVLQSAWDEITATDSGSGGSYRVSMAGSYIMSNAAGEAVVDLTIQPHFRGVPQGTPWGVRINLDTY